jgi:hypothetical protein
VVETSQRLVGEGVDVSSGLSIAMFIIDNARAAATFRQKEP